MKNTKDEIKEAIARFNPYCNFWSGGGFCSYPNSWRTDTRSNLNKCKLIPGKENKICDLSELDINFIGKPLT